MSKKSSTFAAQKTANGFIMTEYEKMLNNLPYNYKDKEVQAGILRAYYAMRDLNRCGAWDMEELQLGVVDQPDLTAEEATAPESA